MGIKDVAGIPRPGLFEQIKSPTDPDTKYEIVSGNATRVTYKACGPGATNTPEFQAKNVADPMMLDYKAKMQGAVKSPTTGMLDSMWPSPGMKVVKRRK